VDPALGCGRRVPDRERSPEVVMVRKLFRKRSTRIVAVLVAVPMIAVAAFGIWLASVAGELPWQTDPTRIAITPFADIPGFTAPKIETSVPTEAATAAPGT
jgi:hypothetical protein